MGRRGGGALSWCEYGHRCVVWVLVSHYIRSHPRLLPDIVAIVLFYSVLIDLSHAGVGLLVKLTTSTTQRVASGDGATIARYDAMLI